VGYAAADLAGLWRGSAAFLVCGGPSLASLPEGVFRLPGVASLGVNNAAAHAGCRAFVFGDPQWKFSHSLFLDPTVLVFAPFGKLRRCVRVRLPNGSFRQSTTRLSDCPNVYGLARTGRFNGAEFCSTRWAQWGRGGVDSDAPFRRLATMLLGLRLLAYLGATRIYLAGVDFDSSGGYAWGDPTTCGGSTWTKIGRLLDECRGAIEAAGVVVRNATPGSKCAAFPAVDFAEALADARGLCAYPPDLRGMYSRRLLRENLSAHPEPISIQQAVAEARRQASERR
jgi:hypothetical protein